MSNNPSPSMGRNTIVPLSLLAVLGGFIAGFFFFNGSSTAPVVGPSHLQAAPSPVAANIAVAVDEPAADDLIEINLGKDTDIRTGEAHVDLVTRVVRTNRPTRLVLKSDEPWKLSLGPRKGMIQSGLLTLHMGLLDTGSIILLASTERTVVLRLDNAATLRLVAGRQAPTASRNPADEGASVPSFD